MESVKPIVPVKAGAAPLAVTNTPRVRLSIVTPVPRNKSIEHETPLPAVPELGQLMVIEFAPHNGAAVNRPASSLGFL
jgi:hypothetical protein